MNRVLAVTVKGGHLAELGEIVARLPGATVDWVAIDTPQSRALLAGQRVHFVADIGIRDVRGVARTVPTAVRLLRGGRYAHVIGSGSISLAFLPVASRFGVGAHFLECATRAEGPSLTGRILERAPGVRLYTQHPRLAVGRWQYGGSVYDSFERAGDIPTGALRRVVVTVGMNPFPFRRLIEHLLRILPPHVEVLWQTGATDTTGLPLEARPMLSPRDLATAMRDADVVVAHAGTGSSLQALDSGRMPVLVPRRAALGEQTDDHQSLLVEDLCRRGLAIGAEVEDLAIEVLESALGRRVRRRVEPLPFTLEGGR